MRDEQSAFGRRIPYIPMSKNLQAAIADLRAASVQMRAAAAKPATTKKTSKNRRKRAARRAAKAASGSASFSPLGQGGISAPVAFSRQLGQRDPMISMTKQGRLQVMTVRHREYVAEVPGATAWTVTSYVVQPALQTLFVWLASIAGNFEKYRLRALRFYYETESATSQAGSVVFAFDFDALDAAPTSKQAALSYKNHVRSAPWAPVCLQVDLRDAQRDFYYTRSGAVPSGADQKTYDVGVLHVGVQNSSGSTGELHVEYDIELHDPQPNVTPISGKITGTTGLSSSALVGSDAAYATGSNVGWALTSSSTLTATIAGTYLFAMKFAGTTLVGGAMVTGGTSTLVASGGVVNSAGTEYDGWIVLTAQVGQTFIPALSSAASVTSSALRLGLYQAALA